MITLSSKRFLHAIALTAMITIVLDIFRSSIFYINTDISRIFIVFTASSVLVCLLYYRLSQYGWNRAWSILGFFFPIGIIFGFYIYMKTENYELESE